MSNANGDATVLLGMEGFIVLSQMEEDGELWVLIETTANRAGYPRCALVADSGHRTLPQHR